MWYKILIFQPARRSYERQRRVQYYNSESEEEEEQIEETKNDPITTKEDKKCYKKANTTKTVKAPKVTKAKQRIAKEVWYSFKTQNIYIIFIFYLLCIVLQYDSGETMYPLIDWNMLMLCLKMSSQVW